MHSAAPAPYAKTEDAPFPPREGRVFLFPCCRQQASTPSSVSKEHRGHKKSRGKAAACHRLSSLTGKKLPGPRNRKRLVFLPALLSIGAEGESRTPTPLPELDPEPSVSTNSTTSAQKSVYRIRPPAGKLFFRFFPFFYFNKQNRDDKRQHSQAPGDCCPSCRQRIRKTRRPADSGRDGCRPRNSPASRHRGRPAMCHDGIWPSGGCRLFGRYAGSAGWRRTRTDGTCPPLAQAADFSQTGGPAKAGKTQGTHMRSTAPQPSRPTFYLVPALRHGENGISFRPQPRKQPLSGCSPSRAAAALATLSPISPAAATGTSGAWR